MATSPRNSRERSASDVSDELADVNARTRRRGPQRLRQKIEASIEAKARKRRAREGPASAAWKS